MERAIAKEELTATTTDKINGFQERLTIIGISRFAMAELLINVVKISVTLVNITIGISAITAELYPCNGPVNQSRIVIIPIVLTCFWVVSRGFLGGRVIGNSLVVGLNIR